MQHIGQHVSHVVWRNSSVIKVDNLNHIYFSFILLAETINDKSSGLDRGWGSQGQWKMKTVGSTILDIFSTDKDKFVWGDEAVQAVTGCSER